MGLLDRDYYQEKLKEIEEGSQTISRRKKYLFWLIIGLMIILILTSL